MSTAIQSGSDGQMVVVASVVVVDVVCEVVTDVVDEFVVDNVGLLENQ